MKNEIQFVHQAEPSKGALKMIEALNEKNDKEALEKMEMNDEVFQKFLVDTAPAPLPQNLKDDFHIKKDEFDGYPSWTITPKDRTPTKVIMYVHGGGYSANIYPTHWGFVHALAKQTDVAIVMPAYPLVPAVSYEEIKNMIDKVYQQLLVDFPTQEIIFMGDSAGGHFIFSYLYFLQENKGKMPAKVIGFCPWLDVTMSNPEIENIAKVDPLLLVKPLKFVGKKLAGGRSTSDPLISPVHAVYKTPLPKFSLFSGTHEVLYPDCKVFIDNLRQNDIPINSFIYENMFHTWMLFLELEEAQLAFKQVVHLVND